MKSNRKLNDLNTLTNSRNKEQGTRNQGQGTRNKCSTSQVQRTAFRNAETTGHEMRPTEVAPAPARPELQTRNGTNNQGGEHTSTQDM